MTISALVLTKNEEEMIKDCLKQLTFADEIVIVDQDSVDNTLKIARKYTDRIFKSTANDFAQNRNTLKDKAKSKWLLYVDADERLPQELIREIKIAISKNDFSAFYIPRKNYVLGKWVRYGGWWPDYAPRLFKKSKLEKWEGVVHESPVISGKISYLKTPIEHLSARSMSQMFSKSIKWAKIEADLSMAHGHRQVSIASILKLSAFEFMRRYILKMGFLDGVVGLIEGIYQSLHQAMALTYLWEEQNRKNRRKTL